MAKLIVIKHAAPQIVPEVASFQWKLSPSGLQECEALASRLASYAVTALYSSEETKAQQTADRLGQRLGLTARARPGLHENDRTGFRFFHDPDELDACFRDFFARPVVRIVGKESAAEAQARFRGAVQAVLDEAGESLPAIVTHGTVLTLLVGSANEIDLFAFWKALTTPSFVVLSVPRLELLEVVHAPFG
jgi:broad specificity phosphatase PhoE